MTMAAKAAIWLPTGRSHMRFDASGMCMGKGLFAVFADLGSLYNALESRCKFTNYRTQNYKGERKEN